MEIPQEQQRSTSPIWKQPPLSDVIDGFTFVWDGSRKMPYEPAQTWTQSAGSSPLAERLGQDFYNEPVSYERPELMSQARQETFLFLNEY